MTEPAEPLLAKAREQVRRILDQLEAVRWQLLGIKLILPEPSAEHVRLLDVADVMDATTELRTVIHCVLEDCIRPAVEDLNDALLNPGPEDPTL